MSARSQVLLEDSRDFFNRHLARVLLPATTIWIVFAFLVSNAAHDGPVSVSRDAGLRMTLVAPFPPWLLALHSYAGALLLLSVLAQKWLVKSMSAGLLFSLAVYHRWNGYFCLFLMLVMSTAGYWMAPFSAWQNFELFSVAFAAPWLLWVLAVFVSARLHNFRFHRLMGNQAMKGAITVPLARLAGAAAQRLWPQLGEAMGYYAGIAAVTIVVGFWEMSELYAYFVQPCGVDALARRNKAKGK